MLIRSFIHVPFTKCVYNSEISYRKGLRMTFANWRVLPLLLLFTTSLFAFLQEGVLSPEEAFNLQVHKEGDHIHTVLKLGKGIYVYDEALKYSLVKPKKVALDKEIQRPKPVEFHHFIVHRGKDIVVDIPLALIRKKIGKADAFTLQIAYQGCSEKGLCYQPMKKEFHFSLSKAAQGSVWKPHVKSTQETVKPEDARTKPALSEESSIAEKLKHSSLFTVLILFFGFGLLLALTPCVFPMIPILSSVIVMESRQSQHMSMGRGIFLSAVYAVSAALVYAIAGVLAGLFGANIQTAMQNPWVLGIFSLIFVALAFSMFGYYEIQLPRAVQNFVNKKSDSARGSGVAGAAIMGLLSALIVGPCVAPPLAGALLYIGQTGDALLGGLALFTMGLGMGAPLLLVGAGAGKFMPKPGGWMTRVSYIFGVVMLFIAVAFLSRILPAFYTLLLYALLLIGSGIYAGALEPFKEGIAGIAKIVKVFAFILLLLGSFELVGALSGASDPLEPFARFTAPEGAAHTAPITFRRVESIAALEDAIAKSDKPVMIDFSAKWCAACKELEHTTFADAQVQALMRHFTLLRVDVTDNGKSEKALLKRYGIFGPPAIVFYDAAHHEMPRHKIVGYKPPAYLIRHLQTILKGN